MQNKKYTVILCVLNVIKSILVVGQALVSKFLIDEASSQGQNFWLCVYFLAGMIVGLIAVMAVYYLVKKKAVLNIEVKMKKNIFMELSHKDIRELNKYHSGQITNIYLNDISNMIQGETETIPSIFLYVSRLGLAVAALIYIDWLLLVVLLVLGIIAFICARIYSKIIKKYSKASLESDGNLNSYMQESYQNMKLVKAMGMQENVEQGLDSRLSENYLVKNKKYNIALFGSVGLSSLMYISFALTLIYCGFCIYQGTMSYGSLVALTEIVSYFEIPLSALSGVINKLVTYKVSKNRIKELYDLKEDIPQQEISDFDSIELKDISFGYEKDRLIYHHFSYKVNKGDKILIKGPSGKGKSTLFNIMLGFVSLQGGEAILNDQGKQFDLASCRNVFSCVSQENILFSGTVRENIELFISHPDSVKVQEALQIACVYEELMAKPKGLDTPLTERGGGLSLGQVQRVLLAIALLKDRPVLLLDEFTSALDKKLEQEIVSHLSKLDKTMLIITHRDISVPGCKTLILGEDDE